MRRHIERLRQKPEHIRKQVAFAVSAGVVGIMAIIWVSTIHLGIPNINAATDATSQGAAVGSTFDQLKQQFQSDSPDYSNLVDGFNGNTQSGNVTISNSNNAASINSSASSFSAPSGSTNSTDSQDPTLSPSEQADYDAAVNSNTTVDNPYNPTNSDPIPNSVLFPNN